MPDLLLIWLKPLSGTDAHLTQSMDVRFSEASVSEDAPRRRDPTLTLQEAQILSAYPKLSGYLGNPEFAVLYCLHRRGR